MRVRSRHVHVPKTAKLFSDGNISRYRFSGFTAAKMFIYYHDSIVDVL